MVRGEHNRIIDFKQHIKNNTKIDKNGCWIWQKSLYEAGYGACTSNVQKGPDRAHRVSYRVFTGPITNNMIVLHSCDVPACCNPQHLRLGTHLDNSNDKLIRNRLNTLEASKTKLKRLGYVITPYGKLKTLRLASNKENAAF